MEVDLPLRVGATLLHSWVRIAAQFVLRFASEHEFTNHEFTNYVGDSIRRRQQIFLRVEGPYQGKGGAMAKKKATKKAAKGGKAK